jgi:hypothetical protein
MDDGLGCIEETAGSDLFDLSDVSVVVHYFLIFREVGPTRNQQERACEGKLVHVYSITSE